LDQYVLFRKEIIDGTGEMGQTVTNFKGNTVYF